MLSAQSRPRLVFLTIGLIGLVVVVADAAGWARVTSEQGLPAALYSSIAVSVEKVAPPAREAFVPPKRDAPAPLAGTPTQVPTPTPRAHPVQAGESLLEIAARYGVSADVIAEANDLWDPNRLKVGQVLTIPPPGYVAQPAGQDKPDQLRFWWPLQGEITTYFGDVESYYRGGKHTGMDVAAKEGAPVRAAAAGKVVEALKPRDNLGWHIILDHGGGYSTVYGHLSRFFVDVGDSVKRGEVIGAAGDTGFSFGPHLHFEVRQWGVPKDPLDYLP